MYPLLEIANNAFITGSLQRRLFIIDTSSAVSAMHTHHATGSAFNGFSIFPTRLGRYTTASSSQRVGVLSRPQSIREKRRLLGEDTRPEGPKIEAEV